MAWTVWSKRRCPLTRIDFGPITTDVIKTFCSCPIKQLSPVSQHHDQRCRLITHGVALMDKVIEWSVQETMTAMLAEEDGPPPLAEPDRTKAMGVTEWIRQEEMVNNLVYRVTGEHLVLGIWRKDRFLGRRYSETLGRWILALEKHWDAGGPAKPLAPVELVIGDKVAPAQLHRTLAEMEQELGLRVL